MFHKQFDVLLSRMARSEVAVAADLVGCNAAEIAAIESKYKIQIPSIYRRYLEIMGHKSGRLFTSDHAAAFYPYVLNLTADFRTEMRDLNPPPSFALPGDALIICCRLGEQFEFIRCNSPDESIVYYFNSWNWDIVESTESIIAWLDRWCCAAEEAIASGYYKASPNGTAPCIRSGGANVLLHCSAESLIRQCHSKPNSAVNNRIMTLFLPPLNAYCALARPNSSFKPRPLRGLGKGAKIMPYRHHKSVRLNSDVRSHMDRSRRFRIFHEALAAAARGPFFPDWEFHTLFGLERSEVEQIAFNFAESTEIDGAVRLAINGAMNNLLGYPHGCDNQWHDWLSVTRHELSEIYELWLSDPRSEP